MSASPSLAETKRILREEKLRWRGSLSEQDARAASGLIAEAVRILPEYKNALTILFYVSAKANEVDTHALIREALSGGVRVFVPVTDFDRSELIISELKDMEELERVRFGLLEPASEFVRPVDPQVADVIIVPGVAFDSECRRIGFGGGYYDRLLVGGNAVSIALAYAGQMVERVPTGEHDIPVDIIVTEERIYQAPRA
jgi:5-formyltetrahydrofolate cyclo-ligase